MKTMLKVEQITKDFYPPVCLSSLLTLDWRNNKPLRALDNVSFSLSPATVLGVLGPNGAGKTTLLKIISGLILPDQGQVWLNDYQLGVDDQKIKLSLGLAAEEERSFYWRLSGRENLEFFAALYGLGPKTTKNKISALLEQFSARDYADKRFATYSAGMKKRFALMRSLLHDPTLLLLDEPTKSLDYRSRLSLKKLLREELAAKQKKSIIFTSHEMNEAGELADLLIILDKGKLVACATLEELRQKTHLAQAGLDEIFLKLTRGTKDD